MNVEEAKALKVGADERKKIAAAIKVKQAVVDDLRRELRVLELAIAREKELVDLAQESIKKAAEGGNVSLWFEVGRGENENENELLAEVAARALRRLGFKVERRQTYRLGKYSNNALVISWSD
jgi:hypothetical protein